MQNTIEGGKRPQEEDILKRAQCVDSVKVKMGCGQQRQLNEASLRKGAVI